MRSFPVAAHKSLSVPELERESIILHTATCVQVKVNAVQQSA